MRKLIKSVYDRIFSDSVQQVPAIFIADQSNYSGRRTKHSSQKEDNRNENLTTLFVDQFVKWNEVYRKVIPGYDDVYVQILYKYRIIKLPRDDNGNLDVLNETY